MSTRCTISVTDQFGTFSLYRHSDGYPESKHGVLATLPQAFAYSWPFPRFEADDFAAAIVRAWKDAGGNIRLHAGRDAQGDTEYHYDISMKASNHPNAKPALQVIVSQRQDDDTWKETERHALKPTKGAPA